MYFADLIVDQTMKLIKEPVEVRVLVEINVRKIASRPCLSSFCDFAISTITLFTLKVNSEILMMI